jgi:hypothetical protein
MPEIAGQHVQQRGVVRDASIKGRVDFGVVDVDVLAVFSAFEHPSDFDIIDPPLFIVEIVHNMRDWHDEESRDVFMELVIFGQQCNFYRILLDLVVPFEQVVVFIETEIVREADGAGCSVSRDYIVNFLRIVVVLTRGVFGVEERVYVAFDMTGGMGRLRDFRRNGSAGSAQEDPKVVYELGFIVHLKYLITR